MISFPSIKQFRDVIRHVKQRAQYVGKDDAGELIYNQALTMPKLRFRGSVKLHGTNAAIVITDKIELQSRERVLSAESDNAGFYAHMSQDNFSAAVRLHARVMDAIGCRHMTESEVAIYGEWCGGNIQRGIALNGLPKMFVIFAVKVDDKWCNIDRFDSIEDKSSCIYSISQFPQFDAVIDFEHPEMMQNELGAITERVEAQCPVGLHFGNDGIGEGVVWRCVDNPSSDYWFKVKGEKHSASHVKTLAAVDVEAMQKISDFIEMAVTESRLEQGLQNLINEQQKPFEMSSMGDFIRWVYGDIIKEESDTIAASGFDSKKLGLPIANAARKWYIEKFNATT